MSENREDNNDSKRMATRAAERPIFYEWWERDKRGNVERKKRNWGVTRQCTKSLGDLPVCPLHSRAQSRWQVHSQIRRAASPCHRLHL